MIRIPLKNDCCYKLKGNCHETEYRIISHIGSGANTLVYIAEKENHFGKTERCILKEFYPERIQLSRCEDGNLIAKDLEVFKELKILFYSKNSQISDLSAYDDVNGSFSVCHINYFLNGNGTLYAEIPVESYKTYAEINNETLIDMLKAICDLCAIVGALHDFGYLHLDLKPSNLLCVEHSYNQKSSRLLKFLDLDTAVKKDDLYNGDFSFSYSEGYSAPEQKQFNIAGISEKTDIFSIGAILFERIFGYLPSFDDMKSDAEFVFEKENKLFFGVNACFYSALSDFFKKTICCNPDNRFESCIGDGDSVIEAVKELIKFVENSASVEPWKMRGRFCPKCNLVDESGVPFDNCLYPQIFARFKNDENLWFTNLTELLETTDKTGFVIVSSDLTLIDTGFREQCIYASTKNNRYILTGFKDGGKSSLLKKLYNDLLNEGTDYSPDFEIASAPIYISVSDLNVDETIIKKILRDYCGYDLSDSITGYEDKLKEAFSTTEEGKRFPAYTLLIDGLNDASADRRKLITEEINSFAGFKNLCIIVSSTDLGKDLKIATSAEEITNNPGSFVEIRVDSLSLSRIKKYIIKNNPKCAKMLEDRSLYKILGNNISVIKMLAKLKNIEAIESETDIINYSFSNISSSLADKLKIEKSNVESIFAQVCRKMLEHDTNVTFKSDFEEIVRSSSLSESVDVLFEEFSKCGVFSHDGKERLVIGSTMQDYIVAKLLKSELEKICDTTCGFSPDNNFLISSRGFNINTLTYLSELTSEKKMLAYGDNGRLISDSFTAFFTYIKTNQTVRLDSNPHYLLTLAFTKVSSVKYKQIKAMAAVNILKAMQIARNGSFFEEELKLLKLQNFNADFSCVKQDVYAAAYYNEIKAFIGRKVSVRNMVNAILFPISAALIIAFICFYAIPHLFLKPPEIEVSASYDYPSQTISDWSEYSFTIVDVNGTNTIARSSLILESAFGFSGFSGEIVLDKIIDANHATMKLKVDKITDTECFVYLKDGVLESIGDYNTFESNKGKTLFSFNTQPNTQSPLIGMSVNGVKYNPSYNTGVSVKHGDKICIKAIAPIDGDSVEYIKYKIGTYDPVTVAGDYAEIEIPDNLQAFSVQVLARTKNGSVNEKWLNYNIYVLPIAPPTVEVRVNDVLLSPFDENLTIKPGDYIRVTAIPSVSTGSDIAYIEYKFGKEDIQTVYESDILLRVEDYWTELYFQTRVTDVDGNQMPQASRFLFTVER